MPPIPIAADGEHIGTIREFVDAGFDCAVHRIGTSQTEFVELFDFYENEVLLATD